MTVRLDRLLVDRGLARSRSQAAALIRQGRVRVDGVRLPKAATSVSPDARVDVESDPWVSRAAHKLLGALEELGVAVPARCLDAGASTGGFTQVLLAQGAERVFAVDVGTGQLAPALRNDPRVIVHERTNLRDLTLQHVDECPVGLVVADVSFISLRLLLDPLLAVLAPDGEALLMVKPQFEVGREHLGKGGVVREEGLRAATVASVAGAAAERGWRTVATAESVLPGPAGNVEYFLHLRAAHLC